MPTAENKDIVRRILAEVVNQGQLDVADQLLASDYVYRSPGSPELRGPEGYKQLITTFRSAFPDLHVTLDDMIAEGDKVVTGFTWRGTHRGEFMGLAPTGKRVTVAGLIVTRFEGGKAIEDWEVVDALGMLQQLGAVSAPAQAAAATQ